MSDLETIIQKLVRQELQEQMPGIIARALDEDRRAHRQPTGDSIQERLTVAEAAVQAKRSRITLHRALEGAELHGTQRAKGGTWRIQRQCLLAWMDGDPCIHKQNVSPLRPRRPTC
ncbi:helix-turn-helix domain-containing protein [Clavibacter tessellarius]|nr:hypothetical protein [Clavibacter michiganensis]UKF33869.1 helix-turn-helix domain-containing protein [Clavibacter michiganensis subsp. tessellarius]